MSSIFSTILKNLNKSKIATVTTLPKSTDNVSATADHMSLNEENSVSQISAEQKKKTKRAIELQKKFKQDYEDFKVYQIERDVVTTNFKNKKIKLKK